MREIGMLEGLKCSPGGMGNIDINDIEGVGCQL